MAILLLISTVGITVDKHYCGGYYIGTWFYALEDACGMDMPDNDDCCHDDITIYSVQSEFQYTPITQSPVLQLVAYVSFPLEKQYKIQEEQFINSFLWQLNLPPPTTPKVYIKVQSFLI